MVAATRYSFSGLQAAWRFESAFRQETTLAALLIPIALWLGTTAAERALLIAVLGIVIITELLNSAVEAVVDRVGKEHHALAGRAKDMGSAAVFISLVLTLVTWGVIAFGRFA